MKSITLLKNNSKLLYYCVGYNLIDYVMQLHIDNKDLFAYILFNVLLFIHILLNNIYIIYSWLIFYKQITKRKAWLNIPTKTKMYHKQYYSINITIYNIQTYNKQYYIMITLIYCIYSTFLLLLTALT